MGHENGKPSERRGRKTTKLKRATARHASRVPEWRHSRGPTVNNRTRTSLAALIVACAACAGSDSLTTDPGVSHITTTDVVHTSGTTAPSSPVTPPTSTTPSSSPSSSTGSGLTGLAFVSDDFSKYASTADLQNNISVGAGGSGSAQTALYSDGLNASLAELDNTVRYNGHATMKYNQPGGIEQTPQLHVYFPGTSHIWYRVKVRFSPGFTTTGVLTNSANAYKLISWGWSGPDGSGRIEITNTSQYELYENVQTGPSLIGGGSYLTAGTISTEWSDGGWYTYIVEVDHSKPTGVIRLWRAKDGQQPAYQGQEVEAMSNGTLMPPLTNIAVGLNFNQVRAVGQTQAIWWGQWEVVDGSQHTNPFGVSQ